MAGELAVPGKLWLRASKAIAIALLFSVLGSTALADDRGSQIYREAVVAYEGLNGQPDRAKAFLLFSQAANEGHASALAAMGYMQWRGQGTTANKDEGMKRFKEALPGSRERLRRAIHIHLIFWETCMTLDWASLRMISWR